MKESKTPTPALKLASAIALTVGICWLTAHQSPADEARQESAPEAKGERPQPDGPRPEGGPREADRPRPEGGPREADRPRPEGGPREADRPRPEGGPREADRPHPESGRPDGDKPHPQGGDVERRIRALQQAAQLLQEAGLQPQAMALRGQGERMVQEFRQHHHQGGPRPPQSGGELDGLRREVAELREIVGDLRNQLRSKPDGPRPEGHDGPPRRPEAGREGAPERR